MIKREIYLEKLRNFKDKQIIKVITGIRRCGKSTLMELFKNYLLENGVNSEQIVYINFEDADFKTLRDSDVLYEYLKSKLIKDKMTYVFLDEIQNVINFERTVDSLFINNNVDIYITGSNAYMLSSELATLLSGRYIEIKMLPLSFKEYVSAFEDKTDLSRKFRDYLRYSSFPQAIDFYKTDPSEVAIYMDGIFNTVVYKDVISRNGINNKSVLEDIIRYLYNNIGNTCSIKKISDTLNSNGRLVSNHLIENYVSALVDSYILYKASRFDIKGKEHLRTQDKYYAVDIGLRYHLLGQMSGADMGHILENVVYLELLRRGYKVYIGKVNSLEVDFVAQKPDETIYYQVSLTVRDDETLKRELTPLQKIKDNYPKYIITLDDDLDATYDGINKINAIDWLLE